MLAAASAAARASSMPQSGAIPRARRSAACPSERFSGRLATMAPLAPFVFKAASKARTVGHQSASEQRSARGKSSTSRRSEEHTAELQSLLRISYDVCCLQKTTKELQTNL